MYYEDDNDVNKPPKNCLTDNEVVLCKKDMSSNFLLITLEV